MSNSIIEAQITFNEVSNLYNTRIEGAIKTIKCCDFKLISIKQENKICKIEIHAERTTSPNRELVESIKKLSVIFSSNSFFNSNYNMSKAVDNYGIYIFTFALKFEFWDGKLNKSKSLGSFLNFLFEKNIKNNIDVKNFLLPLLLDIRDYPYTITDREEKKYWWGIKKLCIKWLYKEGFIKFIAKQKSYCDDNLILFEIDDKYSFHLRERNVDFVRSIDVFDLKDIYQKREITREINKEFMDYLFLFNNLNNHKFWNAAEIPLNYNYYLNY